MGRENLLPCQTATELQNMKYVNFLDTCRCSCVTSMVVQGLR